MALNILFIGNSHTYYNHMPRMLSVLIDSENRGFELTIRQCTGDGVGLDWHWNSFQTRDTIRKRPWDYVVLQERSGGPLEDLESFLRHSQLLDTEIRKQGAKTILFLTWANRSRPDTQALLIDAYNLAVHTLEAVLAPVGLAWEAIHRADPEFDLYHRDGRHANPIGSYLTACVFYSVLLNKSPEGLPGSFFYKGKKWVDLEKDSASLVQKVAWETVSSPDMP